MGSQLLPHKHHWLLIPYDCRFAVHRIHHGEKQTWSFWCWTFTRGTVKTFSWWCVIRRRLRWVYVSCCAVWRQDELWTISCLLNNNYWCLHTGGEEWNFHLLSADFFFTPFFSKFYPSAFQAGGVLSSRSGRAGGGRLPDLWTPYLCKRLTHFLHSKFCGIVYRPLVVHCHGHLPICPIWACPWAKNLSNLPQIGSRIADRISETSGWMYPI